MIFKKSAVKFIIRVVNYIKNHISSSFKEFVALIFLVFRNDKDKNIWLIGGHGGRLYSDNSAALHKYVIQKHPDIKIYWVINKNSNDFEKAKENGPIIIKHSLKNYIYALMSDVFIVSHGLSDIGIINNFFYKDIFKVRLGHGFTALKRKRSYGNDIKLDNIFDLFIVNSNLEKNIVAKEWKVNTFKIAVTGMPRYDVLFKKNKIRENKGIKILYMPTWRDWLKGNINAVFKESKFFIGFKSLILNNKLGDLLKKENIELSIYIHLNMREYINIFVNEFKLEQIKFLSLDDDVQKEIVDSDILITDYSSVAWDFLYLNKHVVFYRPDIEEYQEYRGSYINLKDETFGAITEESDEVADILSKILCEVREESESLISNKASYEIFKYRDDENCKRVMEEIFYRLSK